MNMKKKVYITLNTINISFLLFSGCAQPSHSESVQQHSKDTRKASMAKGNSAESQKNLKIGVVLPLTGAQSVWGQDALKGAQLAFNNAKNNGFFKSKPLEIIKADSRSQKEGAQKATTQLIDQGVTGIIGELDSALSLEVAKVCFERGIPMVSLAASYPKLTTIGNNIFRICYTDDFQGPLLAKFAFNECNVRTVGIFTEKDNVYSKSLSLKFSNTFKKLGGKVLEEYLYPSDEKSFIPILKNMKNKGCEGLLMSGFFKKADLILRQARKLKFDIYRFGGDGWDHANFIKHTNKSAIGSFYATHYNFLDERPESQSFVESWGKTYKALPTSVPAALGYDAALVMSYAIKNCNKLNSPELIKSLNNLEKIPGVTGEINFKGRNGNPDKQGIICTLTNKGPVFHQSYEYNEILP